MDNRQLLCQAIADAFNIDVRTVTESTSAQTTASWDSLALVGLINELQILFRVEFDLLEIAGFRDVATIKAALVKRDIHF